MDRDEPQPAQDNQPIPVALNNATVLAPSLTLSEWNVVLGSVAKGSIETHLDLFMKLKASLENELKKASNT